MQFYNLMINFQSNYVCIYMYYIAFPWWHIGKACNPSNKTNQIQIHQIASRYVHRQRWYTETNFSLQMQGWYQQKYFTSSDHFLVGVFLFQSVCSHDMALVRNGYTTKLPNKSSSYTTESLRSCFHFQNTIPLKPVYRDLSFQKHLAVVLLKIIICVLSYCAFIWVPSNSIMYNQTLLGTESTKSCCSWYHSNWSQ